MNLKQSIFLILLIWTFPSCKESGLQTVSSQGENEIKSAQTSSLDSNSRIKLLIDGDQISMDQVNLEKSYLQFYSSESDIDYDASFTLSSLDGTQTISATIDGLQGEGKDLIEGKVDMTQNNSLLIFSDGKETYRFIEGEIWDIFLEKATGKVRLKAAGKSIKGNAYAQTHITTLEIEVQFKDIKTINYQKQ
ncbi:hypothetical protein [Algoriphagus sp. PAP.12]|uniref:hypothetical protein n=1 Tax=Algoriphagus sp. PAP.12 TaxID=2996678 RepID=UPI00227C7B70|nr:hypothetical protein [Algoriphagus sp. PAP.12]